MKETSYVLSENGVVVTPFEESKAAALAMLLRERFGILANREVILGGKKPSPVLLVSVKTRGDGEDIIPRPLLQGLSEGLEKILSRRPFGMEVDRLFRTAKDIGRAVSEVEIEVEDQGASDFPFVKKPLDGNGDIVEVTESPAGVRVGVVTGGPNQAESGLAREGCCCCRDRPTRRKAGNLEERGISFDRLDVSPSVNPFKTPDLCSFGLDKGIEIPKCPDDCLHPSRSRSGIGRIDLEKAFVKDHLHGMLFGDGGIPLAQLDPLSFLSRKVTAIDHLESVYGEIEA